MGRVRWYRIAHQDALRPWRGTRRREAEDNPTAVGKESVDRQLGQVEYNEKVNDSFVHGDSGSLPAGGGYSTPADAECTDKLYGHFPTIPTFVWLVVAGPLPARRSAGRDSWILFRKSNRRSSLCRLAGHASRKDESKKRRRTPVWLSLRM